MTATPPLVRTLFVGANLTQHARTVTSEDAYSRQVMIIVAVWPADVGLVLPLSRLAIPHRVPTCQDAELRPPAKCERRSKNEH